MSSRVGILASGRPPPTWQNNTAPVASATSIFSGTFPATNAFNTSLPLTGSFTSGWISANGSFTNQRLYVRLPAPLQVRGVRVVNHHHNGTEPFWGARNVTMYLLDADPGIAYNTNVTPDRIVFSGALSQYLGDAAPWQTLTLSNAGLRGRFFVLDIADNFTTNGYIGVRRVQLFGS